MALQGRHVVELLGRVQQQAGRVYRWPLLGPAQSGTGGGTGGGGGGKDKGAGSAAGAAAASLPELADAETFYQRLLQHYSAGGGASAAVRGGRAAGLCKCSPAASCMCCCLHDCWVMHARLPGLHNVL